MALDEVKNFAIVTVSTGYDASATSIVLTSGHGAKLPTPTVGYSLIWWNSTDYSNPADDPNAEIVRCTGKSTDTLTVTRAQEGTSAATHNTGSKTYKMMLGITAKMITDIDANKASISVANVLDYGAVADDSTDCLTAFTNALASGKRDIYVPPGTYYLSNTITLPAQTTLRGGGVFNYSKLHFAEGKTGILCSGNYARIENIGVIYTTTSSNTANIGISITSPHIHLDHVIVEYAFIGVKEASSSWLCYFNVVNTVGCATGMQIGDTSGFTNTNVFIQCYSNNAVKTYYTTGGGYGFELLQGRAVMYGCAADNAATAGCYVHKSCYVHADIFTGDNCGKTVKVDVDSGTYAIFDAKAIMGVSYSIQMVGGVQAKIIIGEQLAGCSVYLSEAQSINGSAETQITFDSENFDLDSSFDTTTHRFTPIKQGYYLATLSILFTGVADSKRGECSIRVNGTGIESTTFGTVTGAGYLSGSISKIVYLDGIDDYVDATAYQNDSTARSLNATQKYTNMTIMYLGDGIQKF